MGLTDVGIVAIDIVFALAVVAAVSCLAVLVWATIRERAALSPAWREPAGVFGEAPTARRLSGSRVVTSLQPSAVHHHGAPSS
jgi:hypothetical protein